jgi:hypothetical protein
MGTVVDTVVLHYFLLVEKSELLLDLLEPPVGIPRIVYDPDEGESAGASELRRNIRYEERIARTSHAGAERHAALQRVQRLEAIDPLVGDPVQVFDMTDSELDFFGRLTAERPDDELSLVAPLGAGEAACVAIAIERGHVMATDDADGLRVLHRLRPNHPYERIRRLLIRAGENALVTRDHANNLHRRMREMGFWDAVDPFPGQH